VPLSYTYLAIWDRLFLDGKLNYKMKIHTIELLLSFRNKHTEEYESSWIAYKYKSYDRTPAMPYSTAVHKSSLTVTLLCAVSVYYSIHKFIGILYYENDLDDDYENCLSFLFFITIFVCANKFGAYNSRV